MREFRVNPIPGTDTVAISSGSAAGALIVMLFAPGSGKIWEILQLTISCRGNLNQQMAGWVLRQIDATTGGTNIVGDTSPASRIEAVGTGEAAFVSGDGGIFTHAADGVASNPSGTLGAYLGPQQEHHVQGPLIWTPVTTSGRLIELNSSRIAALHCVSAPAASFTPVISALVRVRG